MGTDSGLCRFDGTEIRAIRIPISAGERRGHDRVTALVLGTDEEIWVGTGHRGLFRLDSASGDLQPFAGNSSLPTGEIIDLALDAENCLWVGADKGLARIRLESGKVENFEVSIGGARIAALEVSAKGDVWVGLMDGRLFRYQRVGGRFLLVHQFASPVASLALDKQNGLWIGCDGSGLFRLSTGQSGAVPLPSSRVGIDDSLVPGRQIIRVHCDSHGHLWVASRHGLARLDRENRRWAMYRHDPLDEGSLSGNLVADFCEDDDAVLWIATDGAGVNRLPLAHFGFELVRAGRAPFLDGSRSRAAVWEIHESGDGTVWVGTASGVARWHPDRGWLADVNLRNDDSEIPREDPSMSEMDRHSFVQALLIARNGDLWMGTRGEGLWRQRIDGTTDRFFERQGEDASRGLNCSTITVLHEDREGRVWIGTQGGGLFRALSGEDHTSFLPALTDPGELTEGEGEQDSAIVAPVECRNVTAVETDGAGRTWVGSWEGLFQLDRSLGRLIPYRALFAHHDSLSSEGVLALLGDSRGFLWVGTSNKGLNRLDPITGEVRGFGKADGLPSERIVGVVEDDDGFVWMTTGAGVARLEPESGEIRRFDEKDGLQKGGFHEGAAIRIASGKILLGGAEGFNVIDPTLLPEPRMPRAPLIAGLSISGAVVKPQPGGILTQPLVETRELEIPFDEKSRLAFRLAPAELTDGRPQFVRYRLRGQDAIWSVAGSDWKAFYTGLDPGEYTFEAQGSLDGVRWSEEFASLELEIRPPWYRTWWAAVLIGLGIAFALWGISVLVVRAHIQLQRRLREKAEQQRDRAEAELARQLQHALLIEQTGRELGKDRDASVLFRNAISLVAEPFNADRCAILALPSGPDEGESEGSRRLRVLAQYRHDVRPELEGEVEEILDSNLTSALEELMQDHEDVFLSEERLAEDDRPAARLVWRHWSARGGLILRRTSFLDEPNGLIVLHREAGASEPTAVENQTLDMLAKQIGTAVAQWSLARNERAQREALDEARRGAEKANAAKSEFLAKMTHELRTPLNAILGFSEVMNDDPDLSERHREVMAIINNSGEHLHEVINGVLDLAKIEAGRIEVHPARFDLERMLRSLHKMLSLRARSKGLYFPLEMRSALPQFVETDKSKVRQVLINLLGNAIKFTDTGTIRLAVSAEVAGEIVGEGIDRSRPVQLHFEVSDSGRGIAEEDLKDLFEQYSQTESSRDVADSTGLGLAIAKAFVELLGGTIQVESTLNEGTTFRFSVLCDEVSVAEEESPETSPSTIVPGIDRSSTGKKASPAARRLAADQPEIRVLIAEDQMPNRLLLRKLLGPAGFSLKEAEDGASAVEIWRDWKPHLILMDEQMPHLTGREATRAILEEISHSETVGEAGAGGVLPVIVSLTAMALENNRSAAIEAGCSDFLAKPFRSDELFGVITRNLPQIRFEGDERPRCSEPGGDEEDASGFDGVMLAG